MRFVLKLIFFPVKLLLRLVLSLIALLTLWQLVYYRKKKLVDKVMHPMHTLSSILNRITK